MVNLVWTVLTIFWLASAGWIGYVQGGKSVQAELDAYRAATAEAQEQQRTEALTRERALQANANRLRKDLTDEKTRLAAVQRELADSLRERADRPGGGGVPTPAGDRDAAPGQPAQRRQGHRGRAQLQVSK